MDFKYPPEHYVPPPELFGRPPVSADPSEVARLDAFPSWSGPGDTDPARRAARVQDQVSRFVRQYLKVEGLTQKRFARRIGMDIPKVSRLLTGAMWASLTDLETLLGGCGETLTSVALAVGDGSHQSPRVKRVIAAYLREQLAKVEEETSHSEPAHPSTEAPPLQADLAWEFPR